MLRGNLRIQKTPTLEYLRAVFENESFEIILKIQFTQDRFPNSSTFVSLFYVTRMIYVIHVYVSIHSPIVCIHSPTVGQIDYYIHLKSVIKRDPMYT